MINLKSDSVANDFAEEGDTTLGEIPLGEIVANLTLVEDAVVDPSDRDSFGPAVNHAAVPVAGARSGTEGRPDMAVGDLKVGRPDARGVRVEAIYAVKPGIYAVYRAEDQMMVHFADDPAVADEQRCRLAALAGARAKLALLTSQMRNPRYYEGQTATAFQLALDAGTEQAAAAMAEAVANAERERACAGRLQYMFYGVVTGLCFLAAFGLGYWYFPFPDPSSDLWLAAIGGTVGAIFSIAISIRSRTVALDLYRQANITDGVLRILVGVIGAVAMVLLLATGILPELKINEGVISGDGTVWQTVTIVGFVAGFLERLLPNLLEQA